MLTRKMKDSGIEWIGEIPEDWEVRRIGNYFIQLKDKNEELIEDNLLSLSYGNIIRKNINTSDGLLPENFSGYNIVNKNDIVLRMTDLQNDKRSLRTGLVTERGIITSAYITLRKKELQLINPRYIYFLLHAFDINKGFYGMGSGVRQNVNFNDIKKMNIIYPSIDKQERIVNKIESALYYADKIIEKSKQSIEELKKYKQSLITEAVTKGLDPNVEMKDSGLEWIGEIPSNWDINKMKYVTRVNESKYDFIAGENYIGLENVVSFEGVLNGHGKLATNSRESYFEKENILYSKLRPYLAKAFIADFSGACSGEFIVFSEFKGNKRYLLYWLISQTFTDFINATSYGTKMPRSSWEYIKETFIPRPTKDVENRIVSYLDEQTSRIDKLITDKTKVIKELEDYKKSLIYEYVTGKKEV